MQNIGGQSFLVPLAAQVIDLNGLITLNSTATYMWEYLAEERSFDELVTAVVDHFDVDDETATSDVRAFLDKIIPMGLIEL